MCPFGVGSGELNSTRLAAEVPSFKWEVTRRKPRAGTDEHGEPFCLLSVTQNAELVRCWLADAPATATIHTSTTPLSCSHADQLPTDARHFNAACRSAGVNSAATVAAKGIAMSLGLIGYKLGMTQVFTTEGVAEPVTVLQLGPCPVLQIKYPTADSEKTGSVRKDGYAAVQLGFKDKKAQERDPPRARACRGGAEIEAEGSPAEGRGGAPAEGRLRTTTCGSRIPPRHRRVRRSEDPEGQPGGSEFQGRTHQGERGGATKKFDAYMEDMTVKVGDKLTIEQVFKDVLAVDVVGLTKGRGTAGVMKRHNFQGMPAAHGAKKVHRQAGSTSSLASNRGSGRPKKGLKRAGRYGNERVTIRNLTVVKVDVENNLLLVRGGIPGFKGAVILVSPTNKVGPGSPKAKTKRQETVAKKGK